MSPLPAMIGIHPSLFCLSPKTTNPELSESTLATPMFPTANWDALHAEGGNTEYLVFLDDNTFLGSCNKQLVSYLSFISLYCKH